MTQYDNATADDFELLKTDSLGRVRTSREQREALLDAYETGGLSGPKFARVHGVKHRTVAGWRQRRKMERENGETTARPNGGHRSTDTKVTLVEALPTGDIRDTHTRLSPAEKPQFPQLGRRKAVPARKFVLVSQSRFDYNDTATGQIAKWKRQLGSESTNTETWRMRYNPIYQPQEVEVFDDTGDPGTRCAYRYDAAGNRVSKTVKFQAESSTS